MSEPYTILIMLGCARHLQNYDGQNYNGPLQNFDGHLQNYDGHLPIYDGHLQIYDGHLQIYDGHLQIYDGHLQIIVVVQPDTSALGLLCSCAIR
jgi:hypothetical protein